MNANHTSLIHTCLIGLSALFPVIAAADEAKTTEPGFTSLFDGKTFTGWTHSGNWVVEDGTFYRNDQGGSLTYTAAPLPDDF